MDAIHLVAMKMKSILGEEKKVLKELDKQLQCFSFQKEDCEEFKIALAEVCVNAIEHGNGENPNVPIYVTVILRDNLIESKVCDKGKGHQEKKTQEADRGWGYTLIQSFVDSWSTHRDSEDSMFCVVISKRLSLDNGG